MMPASTPMQHPSAARRAHRVVAAVFSLAVLASGCNIDKLLEIDTPSRVPEDRLLVPENANLIATSAVADFECALGAYIVASALGAGEFAEGTQTASRWSYDRRDVRETDSHYSTFGCAALGVYTPINTARYTNDQAARALAGWTDAQVTNRQTLLATTASLAGYSLVLLGEGFCSGVIDVGPERTSQELFDSAEVRFTTAIAAAQAANNTNLLNLAYVGRARARLNMGDLAGAEADAALVPETFVYNASASTSAARRNNRIFQQNNSSNSVSVAPAYWNLTVGGVADPRVPVENRNRTASDQSTPLWYQLKYGSLTAPTPIATGREARLILAEARGGAQGIAILEDLRADAGLAPLTAAEIANFESTLIEERRRWLWLQGNRWYDIRRFDLPLVPAVGTDYAKGGEYGDQRCWPLPDVEKLSNPNF